MNVVEGLKAAKNSKNITISEKYLFEVKRMPFDHFISFLIDPKSHHNDTHHNIPLFVL